MDELIPKLREGLRLGQLNDGAKSALLDDVLNQKVVLNDTLETVIASLKAPRTWEELLEVTGLPPQKLERAITFLGQRCLLDDEAGREAARAAADILNHQTADPDTVPLIIRDEAAFSCTMCGGCCSGHNIGPVSQETIDALAPHKAQLEEITGRREGFFFTVPIRDVAGETQDVTMCRTHHGACHFLDEDNLCSIHRHLDPVMKPRVCQLFPYEFVATPAGVEVSLTMECRGFLEARQGTPLSGQEDALREALKRAPIRRIKPLISLDPSLRLSSASYLQLEGRLHDAVTRHHARPTETMLALREILLEAQICDPPDAPSRDALVGALHQFTDAMLSLVGELEDAYGGTHDALHIRLDALSALGDSIHTLRAEPGPVFRPVQSAALRTLFTDNVHHFLMSKRLTDAPTVVDALARLFASWFIAKGLAYARAFQSKRRKLVPQDLMDALVTVNHLMRHADIKRAFTQLQPLTGYLFYQHFPTLLEQGKHARVAHAHPEFFKF